jgi:hypothetical protein
VAFVLNEQIIDKVEKAELSVRVADYLFANSKRSGNAKNT